jgi:hypothetical protein
MYIYYTYDIVNVMENFSAYPGILLGTHIFFLIDMIINILSEKQYLRYMRSMMFIIELITTIPIISLLVSGFTI